MILTEEQAKTKQCHLSFAVPEIRGSDGSGIRQGGPWACATTGCMAWRWAEAEYETKHAGTQPKGDGWENMNNGYWRRSKPGRLGYCGAAGVPTVPA